MNPELHRRLAASLQRYGVPGGAVAVWYEEQLHEAAAGVINVDTGVDATPDTIFQIGSITKAYTATLVMQQVAAGKLDLDRPVREVLPEFRLADAQATASITPRQLLCHTSGMDGDLMDDVSRNGDAVEKLLTRLPSVGQLHAPGAMFSYCNLGYIVLGRMIEVMTGQVWDDALQVGIVKPIGTGHSVTLPEEALKYRTAVGHWTHPKAGRPEVSESRFAPRSNGPSGTMLATTAADLVRFARMHLDEGRASDGAQVLSSESVRTMQAVQVETPLSSRYTGWALGWTRYDWNGREMFGHDGGTDGLSAFLRIVPDRRLVIALTTNNGRASGVFHDVVGALLDERAGLRMPEFSEPKMPIALDLDRYAGRYARKGQRVELSVDRGRLSAVWSGEYVGQPICFALTPVSRDRFAARLPGVPRPFCVYFLDFDAANRPTYIHMTERAFARAEPRL